MSSESSTVGLAPARVEGLADAMFAIVLTLLVIDIHAPRADSNAALIAALSEKWADFLSYGISFVILGVLWFGHRMEFHYITRMDRPAVGLSLLFLATISFLPFSASLMGRNFRHPLAVAIFGVNVLVATFFRWLIWHHATARHWLIRSDAPARMIKSVRLRAALVPILYLLAIGLCPLSTTVAVILYLAIPAVYIAPASLDPKLNAAPA